MFGLKKKRFESKIHPENYRLSQSPENVIIDLLFALTVCFTLIFMILWYCITGDYRLFEETKSFFYLLVGYLYGRKIKDFDFLGFRKQSENKEAVFKQ